MACAGADHRSIYLGAANQLIAALALLVIASYLLGCKRPSLYAVIPGLLMLLTTLGALVLEVVKCITHVSPDTGASEPQWVLLVFALALIVLALYVSVEVWEKTKGFKTCPCKDPEWSPVATTEGKEA